MAKKKASADPPKAYKADMPVRVHFTHPATKAPQRLVVPAGMELTYSDTGAPIDLHTRTFTAKGYELLTPDADADEPTDEDT